MSIIISTITSIKPQCGKDHTIEQLIHQYKVILHGFLIELPEVTFSKANKPIQEFKDQRSIGIALCHCNQIDIFVFDMTEGRTTQSQDRGSDLGV
jgi:hypothetical protein